VPNIKAVDDGLSDQVEDPVQSFALPAPELGNLAEIENTMRIANSTAAGREALTKFTIASDLITKLVPLVEMSEDLESLGDLHRLCNIMKTLILLNDTAIIEYVVTDDIVLGVVGALECGWWHLC
jgi:protein phosphatase 4 regulatory subunit 3